MEGLIVTQNPTKTGKGLTMKQTDTLAKPNAIAFYSRQGFVPAFEHALAYAGENGHVATLLDIVAGRLTAKSGDPLWELYFTTLSAVYAGQSKHGKLAIIIAHGIGPLSTFNGILEAYKKRSLYGGCIPQEEFRKLEDGAYGEVSVLDPKELLNTDLFHQALFGERWRAYLALDEVQDCSPEESGVLNTFHPFNTENAFLDLAELQDWLKKTPGVASAQLLLVGALSQGLILLGDSLSHEVRMLGMRPGAEEDLRVHPGLPPTYEGLLEQHLEALWEPNSQGKKEATDGFWHLLEMGTMIFTDYPKMAKATDLNEPEFRVTHIERVGEPKHFCTTVDGYHGFMYDINEVQRTAPSGANSYTVKLEETDWAKGYHVASVLFYKATVDTSQRLIRMGEIHQNFKLTMSILDD